MDAFVSATDVCWRQVEENEFAATFYHQGQQKKVWYNVNDTTVTVEITITSLTQLPVAVMKAVTKRSADVVFISITQIEAADEVRFRISFLKNQRVHEVMFNNTGKRLRETNAKYYVRPG